MAEIMDRKAQFRFLIDYWTLIEKAQQQPALSGERRATMKLVNERLARVNEILRTLGPDFGLIRARSLSQHLAAAYRLARATEIISGHQMMSDHLVLGGGPALPLMALDPMISQVVAPLWKAEKYRQAVGDAATSVNQFTQTDSAATISRTKT